mmetsp:Transcript_76218/g.210815  ORF Transcript_76218/g.210815 Transcript_76218/m.210815 type:complete len:428 (+) Transcript_76218:60-1343(+)
MARREVEVGDGESYCKVGRSGARQNGSSGTAETTLLQKAHRCGAIECALEKLLSLRQSLDLQGAGRFALVVGRRTLHTCRLQVMHVLLSSLELALDLFVLRLEHALFLKHALPLLRLHFGFLRTPGLLDLGVLHVDVVHILICLLLRLRVRLHAAKVRRDLLEDGHDAVGLRCGIGDGGVARVPRGGGLWERHGAARALQELVGLLLHGAAALVEVLEDGDGAGDGGPRILGVLDRCGVLRATDAADLGRLLHVRVDGGDHVVGLADVLGQLDGGGVVVLDFDGELLELVRFVIDGGVRLRQLEVAPILVVVLVLLLLHQSEDHLLDHVIDIVERALHLRSKLFSEAPEGLGLEPPGLLAQQVDRLCLGVRALQQRRETQPARPGDQRCLRRRRQGGIRRRLGADASDLRKDADASVDGLHLLLPKR